MPRDEKRRQKSLQRKAAKRKQKHQSYARTGVGRALPTALLRTAATWPLYECLVSRDWNKEGELVQVLVARQSAEGEVAAAAFVVDLACLGVKSAFARLCDSRSEYQQRVREPLTATQALVSADLNLAAKIIQEGIAYARQFGFCPDPDYPQAALLLAGADPDACGAHVPLGKDGKPFFVSGPYDNAPRIVAQLERVAGAGNFHFVVGLGGAPDWLDEDDKGEEDE